MRYRIMATYYGIPYHAGLGPDGNEATLFSPGPPPDELGFTLVGGHWRKQVSITDLGALWQSRLVGEDRGELCRARDDPGAGLHTPSRGRDSAGPGNSATGRSTARSSRSSWPGRRSTA